MGGSRGSIADVWGDRSIAESERWVASACDPCSVGCGLEVGFRDGRIVGVRGRATLAAEGRG